MRNDIYGTIRSDEPYCMQQKKVVIAYIERKHLTSDKLLK